ncbi:MAG: NUDIX domain-containing protein [Trueperaceae bacterium]
MNRKTIYQGHILSLVIQDSKWEIVEHAEAVAVLILRGREVLGVMQPRPAISQTTWELPAGLIDEGETPQEAAKRELAEEVQLTGDLELITQFYTSPGFTNEKLYVFEAKNLSEAYAKPDSDENIQLSWRDVDEVWEEIKAGKVATSSPTVLGLSWARAKM